jgi:hypothetical protein
MDSMSDKIIHIGFPKTATTFLQKSVFPRIETFNFIDFKNCAKIFEEVVYLDDLDYEVESTKEKLAPFLTDKPTLASLESLVGAPFTFKGLNRSRIPARLQELGFNKVIITIRNQTEIIDSLYRQYIYQGGVLRFKDFLNEDQKWNHYLRPFNFDYLKYDKLISLYQNLFGQENVLILPQELLKVDSVKYLKELSVFMGCKEGLANSVRAKNESLSNLSTNILRIINHFTFNSQRPNNLLWNGISTKPIKKLFQAILDPYLLGFFSSKKTYLNKNQKIQVEKYYSKSNAELKKLIELNLQEYSYVC